MSESRCGQQGCWFANSLFEEIMPFPRFALGQRVKEVWVDEFGKEFVDRGVVIGLMLEPGHWFLDGWVYWVRWYEMPANQHLPVPYCDESHESYLQADGGSDE